MAECDRRLLREDHAGAHSKPVFRSVDEQVEAIMSYVEAYNADPKTFVWTKSAEDILEKTRRARAALDNATSALDTSSCDCPVTAIVFQFFSVCLFVNSFGRCGMTFSLLLIGTGKTVISNVPTVTRFLDVESGFAETTSKMFSSLNRSPNENTGGGSEQSTHSGFHL